MIHCRLARILLLIGLTALAACVRPSAPTEDDTVGGAPPAPARPASERLFTWAGRVDGLDLLKFQDQHGWVEHESHRPVEEVRCHFLQPLQAGVFPVVLIPERGRGPVRIIRQGDDYNAFTLLVEVDDTAFGGAGPYRFSVYANPSPRDPDPSFQLFAQVDDDVVVGITGNQVTTYKITGRPVGQLKYYFARPEGLDPATDYGLRIIEGRGTAELLPREDPRREVRIRIQDPAKGSAPYQLSLHPVVTATSSAEPVDPIGR
ncbi:MAG: hypothetical protein JXQ27_06320 [Acidobacteria bacterium]|nr:hypothetical protein [Acidobacteriota bacterium]